ncbi:MAG: penicillin-binding transpeptidase domain-containing protein, partial [Bacilli bacterium]
QLILFPFVKNNEPVLVTLADILGTSPKRIVATLQNSDEPIVWRESEQFFLAPHQVAAIQRLNTPGVYSMFRSFERDSQSAMQAIGIIRKDEGSPPSTLGITGIERTFDTVLRTSGASRLQYQVDATGNAVYADAVNYRDDAFVYFPVTIKTTLDAAMQVQIEQILDEEGISQGGAVLLDIKTNEVRVMASLPKMDEKDPYGDKVEGTVNQTLVAAAPGSVFKTVVLAAAIENIPDLETMRFDCSKNTYGDGLEPNERRRFGDLNVRESFGVSCNRTFAQLGVQLEQKQPGILALYAKKLGITQTVGWQGDVFSVSDFTQFDQENYNVVYEENLLVARAIMQSSIGQLDVKMTPLAMANMMSTIAARRKAESVSIVRQIDYRNDLPFYVFDPFTLHNDSVQGSTYSKLQSFLEAPVDNAFGTAGYLNGIRGSVSGKTGTAQVPIGNNKQRYHKWFAGYFPRSNPQYALVVFEYNTPNDKDRSYITSTKRIIEKVQMIETDRER